MAWVGGALAPRTEWSAVVAEAVLADVWVEVGVQEEGWEAGE